MDISYVVHLSQGSSNESRFSSSYLPAVTVTHLLFIVRRPFKLHKPHIYAFILQATLMFQMPTVAGIFEITRAKAEKIDKTAATTNGEFSIYQAILFLKKIS